MRSEKIFAHNPDTSYFTKSEQIRLSALLGINNFNIISRQHGGNSAVFCLEADGTYYAVKSYPPYAPNQRDRLAAELSIYQLLHKNKVPYIPKLITHSKQDRWLIVEWIQGEIPISYTKSDIDSAVKFLEIITNLNQLKECETLPLAAEACLSLKELLKQIDKRIVRLLEECSDKELHDFISKKFAKIYQFYKLKALEIYLNHNIEYDSPLEKKYLSLIPADFGFHNSIRNASNELFFFDFDYFGWDDPVKLLADILWHPKMTFSKKDKEYLIQEIKKIYSHDPLFTIRFDTCYPLFGLRWTLILLNEFIPVYWKNRQHANASLKHSDAKARQLKLANRFLGNIQQLGSFYE